MHEELGAQEFGIILRGEIWEWDSKSFGIVHLFRYRSSEGSVEQRNYIVIYQMKEEKDGAPD